MVSTEAAENTRHGVVAAPSTIPLPDLTVPPRTSARASTPDLSRPTVTIEAPQDGSTVRGVFELALDTNVTDTDRSRLVVRIDQTVVYAGDYRNPLALPRLERGRHEIEVQIDTGDDAKQASAVARVSIFVQQSSRFLPVR